MMADAAATFAAAPHVVDRRVGLRIRVRRRELGLSQEKLAQALGVTFQQVQKYERGDNRVSASKLWEIARALQVTTSYFFEDEAAADEESLSAAARPDVTDFMLSAEGAELARIFPVMRKAHQRRVLELIRAICSAE